MATMPEIILFLWLIGQVKPALAGKIIENPPYYRVPEIPFINPGS
jgi:hypothetical protein